MSIEQFALFMIVPVGGLVMGAVVFYFTRKDRDAEHPSHSPRHSPRHSPSHSH